MADRQRPRPVRLLPAALFQSGRRVLLAGRERAASPAEARTQGREPAGARHDAHGAHAFAIAHLLGLPGADRIVDHGLAFLWERTRDAKNGGYFWGVDDEKPTDPTKQAYGHAFVLLAASSAMCVGHPDAPRLLADVTQVIEERFWDKAAGATTEEYNPDWSPMGTYRGQNSNMHLTEALMAAFEATGERGYLDKAESIASLIINRHARNEGWRVAEHFTENWEVDRDYKGDPMFRPSGTTPGHALEWSRLLVQLWELGGRSQAWMIEAATELFRQTVSIGWDRKLGGFYYTLDWSDRPDQTDRYWWPCAEGVGAAAALGSVKADPSYEDWYRRIWSFLATHVIDEDARLAARARQRASSRLTRFRRAPRHLSRRPGLPHPSLPGGRQPDPAAEAQRAQTLEALEFVIARSAATKQSRTRALWSLDCCASLAMTNEPFRRRVTCRRAPFRRASAADDRSRPPST